MSEKKYLSKIIAKDLNGLRVISACCSGGKVKLEEIKFLKINKLFLIFNTNSILASNLSNFWAAIFSEEGRGFFII